MAAQMPVYAPPMTAAQELLAASTAEPHESFVSAGLGFRQSQRKLTPHAQHAHMHMHTDRWAAITNQDPGLLFHGLPEWLASLTGPGLACEVVLCSD